MVVNFIIRFIVLGIQLTHKKNKLRYDISEQR
jgi:hypothetical protein